MEETLASSIYIEAVIEPRLGLLGHDLFWRRALYCARLRKSIYGGRLLKKTASKNRTFLETVALKCPPP